jgi:mono/diheme cytochrome c family protein
MKKVVLIAVFILFGAALSFLLPTSYANARKSSANSVTFNKDIAPIFFKSCAECHRAGEAAPFSTLTYKEVRPWARSIREKVISRVMPPWHADPTIGHFKNDRRLTQSEIDKVVAWVDGGAVEGDPRDLPPAPKFVDGWRIGKPDLIVPMPEEFTLEAQGPDEYQYFEVDPGFTEDKWVQMIEARPGNRKIVHHIIAFLKPPQPVQEQNKVSKKDYSGLERDRGSLFGREGFLLRLRPGVPVFDDGAALPSGGNGTELDGTGHAPPFSPLVAFAPGMSPGIWEPGSAKKIPAGSKIILQIHYAKSVGSVQKDRSMVGLIFAARPPLKEIKSFLFSNFYFQIPPGAASHRVTASWTAPTDVLITTIGPHMHVRGKAAEMKVVYPDGRSEVVLNVPRYDFAWQTLYSPNQPLALPKGSKVVITGYFDNSSNNKFNPDPTKAVRFGEPTYDEMLSGLIEYTVDDQGSKPVAVSNGSASRKR